MNKKSYSFKVGDAVVYTAPNGNTHSATVTAVTPAFVDVSWKLSLWAVETVRVETRQLNRLTPFGAELFMAI